MGINRPIPQLAILPIHDSLFLASLAPSGSMVPSWMTDSSVAGPSIRGFSDGLENRETLLEDLNREDIDQSIIPLQGSRPKTSYQNIDWVRWEEEKQNNEHSTSKYRTRRVLD
jgi:hypothetical protein